MSNIRYANDLLLTELARQLHAEYESYRHHLTDGYLGAAFLRLETMRKQIDEIQYRLNDIRFKNEA